ncbi:MAG: hypothetical protein JSR73_17905 [Proteobacteria bacterium]|nr:hypothetical protein [Pseudomonadota bacterium]
MSAMRGRPAFTLALVALLAACGDGSRSVHAGLHATSAEVAIADRVAALRGVPSTAVEVMAGRDAYRVTVSDPGLATAEPDAQAAAAAAIAGAVSAELAADPEYPRLRQLSVAIAHPPSPRTGRWQSHLEQVFEFRRDGDGAFAAPATEPHR